MERTTLQTDDSTELEINGVTITARRLAELAYKARERRRDGYDPSLYLSDSGDVYSEPVLVGLTHIDTLVDYEDLFRGHPNPRQDDEDYEEVKEIIIDCMERDLINKHTADHTRTGSH